MPHASLDVDDVTWAGPETISVIRVGLGPAFVPGDYHYWVHNFTVSPEFDTSGAHVTITKCGVQVADYLVGGASGNGADDLWHVVNFTLAAQGTSASRRSRPSCRATPSPCSRDV